MGTVHDLLESRGRQHVLSLDLDRKVIDAASAYLSDEDTAKGFLFSGWTQATLPHKRLPDDQPWELRSGRVRLLVEPGRRMSRNDEPSKFIGVPYGSRARLIMLYLQTEALQTGSREVVLGRSLRSWLIRMGISPGGKTVLDVRDQAERIARCRMTFHADIGTDHDVLINQNIMDTAMFAEQEERGPRFLETAKLSEVFFEQLRKHPVPIEEAAIRAISNNSMALDIYCWLSYRLHVLNGPTAITWTALMAQFGAGFLHQRHFKPRFEPNLQLALAVYRDARVDVNERGLTLFPSRPPVTPRAVGRR